MKNQKGFSLIEAMVIIATVGVFAAIAMPNFKKYQEKRKHLQDQRKNSNKSSYSNTDDSIVCIDGYKFLNNKDSKTQMLNHKGAGIQCNQ